MADQLACNINFFLYTRFFFGFYHGFQTSKLVQWLARFYCCLICTIIPLFYYSLRPRDLYPVIIIHLTSMEYLLYVLITFLKGNKYLLHYYKKTPLIDTKATNYRQARVGLVVYMCLMFLIRTCGFIKYLLMHEGYSEIEHFFALFDLIMWFAILNGRSPLLFVFALLYTRVRLMRQTLENNNFNCRNLGKHHPRRYIQIYEAIMDELEETNNSMKVELFVIGVFPAAYYLLDALYVLHYLKDYSPTHGSRYSLNLLWLLMEVVMSCSPLFLSAVLADLVTMEVQKMLAIIVERLIDCKNERDRAEIQKLFQLMRSRPFKFTLWRVMPLNVRSLLSFASFTFTTVIAILQTKNWSK